MPRPIIFLKYRNIARVDFHRISKNSNNKGFDFEILTYDGNSYFFNGADKGDSDIILEFFHENGILITMHEEDEEIVESNVTESIEESSDDDFLTEDHDSIVESDKSI